MTNLRDSLSARQAEIAEYGASTLYPFQELRYETGFSGMLAESAVQAFQRVRRVSRESSLRGLGRRSIVGNTQDALIRRVKTGRIATSGLLLKSTASVDEGQFDIGWTASVVSPNQPTLATPNLLVIDQVAAPSGSSRFESYEQTVLLLRNDPRSGTSWVDIDGGNDSDQDHMFPIGLTKKINQMSDDELRA